MNLKLEASRWHIINDEVMGGVSSSEVASHEPGIVFRGTLSLENNGGFASTRCRFERHFNGISGFRLGLRGDGRSYQFRLRADDSPGSIAWSAGFSTDGNDQSIDLDLSEFTPVFRGRKLDLKDKLNPGEVNLVGFMLADSQAGPFSLKIYTIEARREADHGT